MSKLIIGILTVVVLGQGAIMVKQDKAMDRLSLVNSELMVAMDEIVFDSVQRLNHLNECTAFAKSCVAAYHQCRNGR